MIHPLLHVLATRPQLIADHVEAYAELVGDEVGKASTAWIRRLALYVSAGVLGVVGLVFAGVAVMLIGGLSVSDMPMPWLLILVPLLPFVLAGICMAMAMTKPLSTGFQRVKDQFNADMSLLREVGSAP